MTAQPHHGTRIMVIGSGWHMTSGISHYTYRLAVALAERHQVSALLMRRLIPRRAYPGAARVGASVNDASYTEHVPVHDGVDWKGERSMRTERADGPSPITRSSTWSSMAG